MFIVSPAAPSRRTQEDPAASRAQSPERITVALIPKAAEDLQQLQDRTGLSKTDLTNRAITVYEFLDAQLSAGNDVIIRDRQTGETNRILFL